MRRTRGRADIVWCLAGLVVVQAALAGLMEGPRPELRDPEYGIKLRALRARLAEHPGRPLVLALGSSRTEDGLAAGRLAPRADDPAAPLVFNFGLTAHGPLRQLLALNRLLDDGIRPSRVILEQTPMLLPAGGGGLDEVPLVRQRWRDLRVLRDYNPAVRLYARWLEERAAPSYSSRFLILSYYLPNWVPWKDRQDGFWNSLDGWGWLKMVPSPTPESAREEREAVVNLHRQQLGAWFRVNDTSARSVRSALTRCAAAGISTTLILMPECSEARACYAPAAEQALQEFLGRLSAEFGTPVIDARAWCPDDTFRDGQHLTAPGAVIFTERFRREALPVVNGTNAPAPGSGPTGPPRNTPAPPR